MVSVPGFGEVVIASLCGEVVRVEAGFGSELRCASEIGFGVANSHAKAQAAAKSRYVLTNSRSVSICGEGQFSWRGAFGGSRVIMCWVSVRNIVVWDLITIVDEGVSLSVVVASRRSTRERMVSSELVISEPGPAAVWGYEVHLSVYEGTPLEFCVAEDMAEQSAASSSSIYMIIF